MCPCYLVWIKWELLGSYEAKQFRRLADVTQGALNCPSVSVLATSECSQGVGV